MSEPAAGKAPGVVVRCAILGLYAAGVGGVALLAVNAELPPIIPVLYLVGYTDSTASLAAIPALFLLWSIPQFLGRSSLPIASVLFAVALTLFIALWFIKGWSFGVEYQGTSFTLSMLLVNGMLAVSAFLTARTLRKRPSWNGVAAWHAGLFGWLTYFAFPWLGESI